MKKVPFLQALLASFYAASIQAADMSYLASLERDPPLSYEKFVVQPKAPIQAERPVEAKVEYSTCIDHWKRDHSVNHEECSSSKIAGLVYQANRMGH